MESSNPANNADEMTSSSSTAGGSATKPRTLSGAATSGQQSQHQQKRVPTTVIPPASFMDTSAILVLFNALPSMCMMIVHSIFIATGVGNVTPTKISARSVIVDFVLAITTLYLCPQFKHLIVVFAHATVAASLSGGGKSSANAIYATSMIGIAILITTKITTDDIPSHGGGQRPYYNPLFAEHEEASFNTLTTAWSMIPGVIRTVRRIDWAYEFPMIGCQMIAIHVISQGLMPYLRKVYPQSSSSSQERSTSGVGNTSSEDYWPMMMNSTEDYHDSAKRTVISFSEDLAESIDKSLGSDLKILSTTPARKNKRSALVRASQPLWSMLASSIVLAATQESEKDQKSSVEREKGNEADKKNAATKSSCCVVRFVLDNVVVFEMLDCDVKQKDSFLVFVNDIQWPQVSDYSPEMSRSFWIVVHGLTPHTQYKIEIAFAVDNKSPVTCCQVNACTTTKSKTTAAVTTNNSFSPVTTLLHSLTSKQTELSEEKSKLKRAKKEHQKRLASLRGEIDGIKQKIEKDDNKFDERFRRKLLSLKEANRQLEQEVADITEQTKELESKDDAEEFKQLQSIYDRVTAKSQQNSKQKEDLQNEWATKIMNVENELNQLASKHDKLLAKQERLVIDNDKYSSDFEEQFNKEKSRRKNARETKSERRKVIGAKFSEDITKMENQCKNLNQTTTDTWARLNSSAASIVSANSIEPHQIQQPQAQPQQQQPQPQFPLGSRNVSPRNSL